jgi:uncharacterized membrane protein
MREDVMSIRRKWFLIGPAAIAGVALFTFIGGEVVKLLWNWLLPPLFGFSVVTFWQALGLLVLCRILFGGFGRHHRRGWRMKDEERDMIRRRVRERWGMQRPESSTGGVEL